MYLMYVDESGDTGLVNSLSDQFALTGLVVHELRWQDCLSRLLAFRKRMRSSFGLKLREEIHAARLISRSGSLARIPKHQRLEIARVFTKELAAMADINVISVLVDKRNKPAGYNVFEMAWKALIQRFENTISRRNFSGPANADDRGMIFPDHTADKKLVQLIRRMRRYNPIPNQPSFGTGYRNLTLTKVIEDPTFRDSEHSYFIQACDLTAFLLYQQERPSTYMKRKSGHNYFRILDPILCKVAATGDPQGIVRL